MAIGGAIGRVILSSIGGIIGRAIGRVSVRAIVSVIVRPIGGIIIRVIFDSFIDHYCNERRTLNTSDYIMKYSQGHYLNYFILSMW